MRRKLTKEIKNYVDNNNPIKYKDIVSIASKYTMLFLLFVFTSGFAQTYAPIPRTSSVPEIRLTENNLEIGDKVYRTIDSHFVQYFSTQRISLWARDTVEAGGSPAVNIGWRVVGPGAITNGNVALGIRQRYLWNAGPSAWTYSLLNEYPQELTGGNTFIYPYAPSPRRIEVQAYIYFKNTGNYETGQIHSYSNIELITVK